MNEGGLLPSPADKIDVNVPRPGCPVLCVDDDPQLRKTIAIGLRRAGFAVVEAATCAEAKQAMKTGAPMPVVLDVDLPDGNGFELADEWRRDRPDAGPILFISGRDAGECEARAAQLDAKFLHKPFTLPALVTVVQTLVIPRDFPADKTNSPMKT